MKRKIRPLASGPVKGFILSSIRQIAAPVSRRKDIMSRLLSGIQKKNLTLYIVLHVHGFCRRNGCAESCHSASHNHKTPLIQ